MAHSDKSGCQQQIIECPICAKNFTEVAIHAHVNECLGDNIEDGIDMRSADAAGNPFNSEIVSRECSDFTLEPKKDSWSFLKSPRPPKTKATVGESGKKSLCEDRIPDKTGQKLFCSQQNERANLTMSFQPWNSKQTEQEKPNSGSKCLDEAVLSSGENNKFKRRRVETKEEHVEGKLYDLNSKTTPIIRTTSENDYTSLPVTRPQSKLSSASTSQTNCSTIPLAERMRPHSLQEFVGQDKIIGDKTMLRKLLQWETFTSMILWGPPGCGKTTLARTIAQQCRKSLSWRYVQLSATMSGISDIKEAVQIAKNENSSFKRKTVLFIDEIHRFNKLQQDTFLPHVEDGTIVLIGATTENPSFHVNGALLSRCRIIVFEKLSQDDIEKILHRALRELKIGLTTLASSAEVAQIDPNSIRDDDVVTLVEPNVVELIAQMCDGDARCALNSLQNLLESHFNAESRQMPIIITEKDAKESLQRSHVQYDRAGEEHYNCISALHKSIRGSDDNAAIYWLARMLEGGEDPLFIARRLVVCASEDVGLADVHALPLAVATFQACHFIGMPECALNLAHCTTYLSRASKSNEAYAALTNARANIRNQSGTLPGVPLHLRNAPTKLMKQLGYHEGYIYNHSAKGPVNQQYLPSHLQGINFFKTDLSD